MRGIFIHPTFDSRETAEIEGPLLSGFRKSGREEFPTRSKRNVSDAEKFGQKS